MGSYLESTTFVLLAEDCHWESFLRSTSNDEPLILLVNSMDSLNRKNKVSFLLAEALAINPWSLFCRNEMIKREREVSENKEGSAGPWEALFNSQSLTMGRIQALARGYLLRKFWDIIYKPKLLSAKKLFDQIREVAAVLGEQRLQNIMKKKFIHWFKMFSELMDKKNIKATLIQKITRKYNAIRRYRWMIWRARRANWIFIEVCQFLYDRRRLTTIRTWHKFWTSERKHTMSTIIAITIRKRCYLKTVRENLQRVYPVVKRRNLNLFKIVMKSWQIRLKEKLKRRARVKIRFFIRNCLTRVERLLSCFDNSIFK